ncbi:UNVERIFIED_CONTAM: hypothetical protein FKN15_049205 [Acipenser sinensis]
MAQVLEFLARQQGQPPAPDSAPLLTPNLALTPSLPVVIPDASESDLAAAEEDKDAISIAASWDGSPFPQDEEEGGTQDLTFEMGPLFRARSQHL